MKVFIRVSGAVPTDTRFLDQRRLLSLGRADKLQNRVTFAMCDITLSSACLIFSIPV